MVYAGKLKVLGPDHRMASDDQQESRDGQLEWSTQDLLRRLACAE